MCRPTSRIMINVVEITPVQHKHRRNQTKAYHKKVQKRWNLRAKTDKRFQAVSGPKTLSIPQDVFDKLHLCQSL